MLKGYKAIDRYLTTWCHENGFNIKCKLGSDFQYDSEEQTIYYGIAVPEEQDKLFTKICKEYLVDIDSCDIFILSFFHELGHYKTQGDYSDEEWDKYDKFVADLRKKKNLSINDYKKYYLYPIELNATKYGCQYISNNVEKIETFWNQLKPLIMNFYKVNKVLEDEGLTSMTDKTSKKIEHKPIDVNILGTPYKILFLDGKNEPKFKELNAAGYCDTLLKEIKIEIIETKADWIDFGTEHLKRQYKELLRHELVHAFLYESGMDSETHGISMGWGIDEEIVDWFALQSPKIYKVFKSLDLV